MPEYIVALFRSITSPFSLLPALTLLHSCPGSLSFNPHSCPLQKVPYVRYHLGNLSKSHLSLPLHLCFTLFIVERDKHTWLHYSAPSLHVSSLCNSRGKVYQKFNHSLVLTTRLPNTLLAKRVLPYVVVAYAARLLQKIISLKRTQNNLEYFLYHAENRIT